MNGCCNSLAGLEENDYDRKQCQEFFDAYKECKKEEVRCSVLLLPEMQLSCGEGGLCSTDAYKECNMRRYGSCLWKLYLWSLNQQLALAVWA